MADPALGIVPEAAPAEAASGIVEAVGRATGAVVEVLAARVWVAGQTALGAGISPATAAKIAMRLVAATEDTADRLRAAAAVAALPALAPVAEVEASAVAEAVAEVAAAGAGKSRGGLSIEMTGAQE